MSNIFGTNTTSNLMSVAEAASKVMGLGEAVLADRDYEYDGKVIKISKKNFSKVPNDYKNSTKGKEMMITYDDKAGTVSVPVEFTEEVEIEEGPMKRQLQIKKDIEHLRALNSKKITSLSKSEYKQKKQYEKDYGNDPMDWEAFIAPLKFKKEEVAEAKGTAYPATIDTLKKIVKDKQNQTVMFKSGQAIVDTFKIGRAHV